MLEAPPTEIRQRVKGLALQEKWKDLLETVEAVMALPCSRAWLDLQRFAVEACVALGSKYDNIAVADPFRTPLPPAGRAATAGRHPHGRHSRRQR